MNLQWSRAFALLPLWKKRERERETNKEKNEWTINSWIFAEPVWVVHRSRCDGVLLTYPCFTVDCKCKILLGAPSQGVRSKLFACRYAQYTKTQMNDNAISMELWKQWNSIWNENVICFYYTICIRIFVMPESDIEMLLRCIAWNFMQCNFK